MHANSRKVVLSDEQMCICREEFAHQTNPDDALLKLWRIICPEFDRLTKIVPGDYGIPRDQATDMLNCVPREKRNRANMIWLNIGPSSYEREIPMEGDKSESKTLQELAKIAWDIQDACNLSGVVHEFGRTITQLWTHANRLKNGTTWVNRHPIVCAFADKVAHLCGTQNSATHDRAEWGLAWCMMVAKYGNTANMMDFNPPDAKDYEPS